MNLGKLSQVGDNIQTNNSFETSIVTEIIEIEVDAAGVPAVMAAL